MKHSEAFVALVEEAKTRITEVSAEQVLEKQKRKDSFCFGDVREDHEWNEGHASGAIHLGRGILERDIEKVIPDKSACVILYCGGGFRSAMAADNAQKMGYTNVLSMDGGWRGWREKGYPCDKV